MMQALYAGIRMVALDLDRTTLRDDKSLSPAAAQAFRELIGLGVQIVPATGRAFTSLPDCIRNFPGITYVITGNGAAICRMADGSRIHANPLEAESVEQILSIVDEKYPLEAFLQGVPNATADYVKDPKAYGTPPAAISYVQNTRCPVADIRAFIRSHAEELDALDIITLDAVNGAPQLRERIAREVPHILVTSSTPHLIEIAHENAGKAAGVLHLAGILGITPAQIAAFGDAENDRDMIRMAGLGVAVANADEGTRAIADRVTASNQEDGVAIVLQDILRAILQVKHRG